VSVPRCSTRHRLSRTASSSTCGIVRRHPRHRADDRPRGCCSPYRRSRSSSLAYLSRRGARRTFDWPTSASPSIALLSHQRQRKSFYYAGLINTGVALWLITTNYDWFGKQSWAILLVGIGVAGLVVGLCLARRERRKR
jgi:hypothetical protein